MNRNILFKSMEAIDEDLLEKYAEKSPLQPFAAEHTERRSKMLKYVLAIAGFAAAGLIAAVGSRHFSRMGSLKEAAAIAETVRAEPDRTAATAGITIPPAEVRLAADDSGNSDMIGFFIFESRCYVYMDTIFPDPGLADRHLGTITGLIDEWTPEDGYVDFAGSVTGEFYSVKGYDPAFMLCQKYQSGDLVLYICNSGITLNKGSELYTDRLHLKENIKELQTESRDSWFYSRNERFRADKDSEAVARFLDALNEGTFISREDVPSENEWHMIFDERELEHFTFLMEDGTRVLLRLLEGGYVFYQGILDVCIQVPEDVMKEVLSLAGSGERIPTEELPAQSWRRTVEECREDPVFGKYVPDYIPEGIQAVSAAILYSIDPETAEETGTNSISIEYCDEENPHIYYSVQLWNSSDYGKNGYAGPLLQEDDLKDEALENAMVRVDAKGREKEYPWLDMAVVYEDKMVLLSARGLETADCLKVLESARPD